MPSNLPPHWSWVKLGDVAKLIRGVSYKKELASKTSKENYLPIVRATNINSSLNFEDLVYVPKEFIKNEQFICEGDIIIAMSSSSKDLVGKAAQAFADTKVGFGTFCGLVRFSSSVNKRFFGYYFHSREYRDHISKVSMGLNINNLRREHIEELILPLPPLPEQKKIVEKIEELFSGLDSGVASLKKAKEQLRIYRQSVLAYAFTGRLNPTTAGRQDSSDSKIGEIESQKKSGKSVNLGNHGSDNLPEGWKWVKLGEVCEKIVGGGTPSTKVEKYWNGNINWITSADIYGLRDIRPRKKITKEAIENSATNLVRKGTIIVVTRVSLGRLAIADHDMCFSQDSQGLILKKRIVDKDYVLWFLSSATQIFKYKNRGTTIKGVTKKQLADLQFVLPPKDQQTHIVEEIERRFSEADNLEKAIDDSLTKAEILRQSILKQAFEGKL